MDINAQIKTKLYDLKYKESQGEKLSDWELFQKERAEIDDIPEEEKQRIQNHIKLEILRIWKESKGGYFKYDPFFAIKGMEHFPVFATSGDRNIGKTYSAKEQCVKTNDAGKRWIWLRNIQEEIEQLVKSDYFWFDQNGWEHKNSAKAPNITASWKETDDIVGWYRDINTIGKFKSIEFPKTTLVVWDEFSSRVNVQGDKFGKFSEFITTAQRHRKDLRVILQANYVNQDDPILQRLGTGMETLDEDEFVKFDWISGTISLYIPKGIYKSVSENEKKQYLGYRTSLKDFATWKAQYGGGFSADIKNNVINIERAYDLEPQFNIFYSTTGSGADSSTIKMTVYEMMDTDGFTHNVICETLGNNNEPILTFDGITDMRYNNAYLLPVEQLELMVSAWKQGQLKTFDKKTYEIVIRMFAVAKKAIMKDEQKIFEIENILVS